MVNAIELFTGDEDIDGKVKEAFEEMKREELLIPNLKEENKEIKFLIQIL